jgi:hypothetical protein
VVIASFQVGSLLGADQPNPLGLRRWRRRASSSPPVRREGLALLKRESLIQSRQGRQLVGQDPATLGDLLGSVAD